MIRLCISLVMHVELYISLYNNLWDGEDFHSQPIIFIGDGLPELVDMAALFKVKTFT